MHIFGKDKPFERALEFLDDNCTMLMRARMNSIGTLCVLAEELQPGAIVGGTLIDSSSATFDRVVYPSLLASPFSTLRHVPISSPISELARRRCVREKPSHAATPRLKPVSM